MQLLNFLTYLNIFNAKFNFDNNACPELFYYPLKFAIGSCYVNPDVTSKTPEIIQRNGYSVLNYTVTTPDGYSLTLFRIPPEKNDFRKNKQPVFIQHGIAVDSANWVHIGNRSMAFNLADQGYDVWLGNLRGTRYSRSHNSFKDTDFEFWDYNLDNLVDDIRSSLAKVAEETGTESAIIFIGHSKGSTLVFMYAAEYPEESQKFLKGIISMSPIVYLDGNKEINKLLRVAEPIAKLLKISGMSSIFQDFDSSIGFVQRFCSLFPYTCMYGLSLRGEAVEFLPEELLTSFGNFPSTISITEVEHFGQIHNSREFKKFDYGKWENWQKYGQSKPPFYELAKIKLPVFLFFGNSDGFVSQASVDKAFSELGSENKQMFLIPKGATVEEHPFGHVSFSYSRYLREYLYEPMFRVMREELSLGTSLDTSGENTNSTDNNLFHIEISVGKNEDAAEKDSVLHTLEENQPKERKFSVSKIKKFFSKLAFKVVADQLSAKKQSGEDSSPLNEISKDIQTITLLTKLTKGLNNLFRRS